MIWLEVVPAQQKAESNNNSNAVEETINIFEEGGGMLTQGSYDLAALQQDEAALLGLSPHEFSMRAKRIPPSTFFAPANKLALFEYLGIPKFSDHLTVKWVIEPSARNFGVKAQFVDILNRLLRFVYTFYYHGGKLSADLKIAEQQTSASIANDSTSATCPAPSAMQAAFLEQLGTSSRILSLLTMKVQECAVLQRKIALQLQNITKVHLSEALYHREFNTADGSNTLHLATHITSADMRALAVSLLMKALKVEVAIIHLKQDPPLMESVRGTLIEAAKTSDAQEYKYFLGYYGFRELPEGAVPWRSAATHVLIEESTIGNNGDENSDGGGEGDVQNNIYLSGYGKREESSKAARAARNKVAAALPLKEESAEFVKYRDEQQQRARELGEQVVREASNSSSTSASSTSATASTKASASVVSAPLHHAVPAVRIEYDAADLPQAVRKEHSAMIGKYDGHDPGTIDVIVNNNNSNGQAVMYPAAAPLFAPLPEPKQNESMGGVGGGGGNGSSGSGVGSDGNGGNGDVGGSRYEFAHDHAHLPLPPRQPENTHGSSVASSGRRDVYNLCGAYTISRSRGGIPHHEGGERSGAAGGNGRGSYHPHTTYLPNPMQHQHILNYTPDVVICDALLLEEADLNLHISEDEVFAEFPPDSLVNDTILAGPDTMQSPHFAAYQSAVSGRLGEHYAVKYLQRMVRSVNSNSNNGNSVSSDGGDCAELRGCVVIKWVNEHMESGFPFDIVLEYDDGRPRKYCEVKTRTIHSAAVMEEQQWKISPAEVALAHNEKENYFCMFVAIAYSNDRVDSNNAGDSTIATTRRPVHVLEQKMVGLRSGLLNSIYIDRATLLIQLN